MSMNLHCDQVELWQTPTYITSMCLSLDDDGKPDGGMAGVLRRYMLWVHSHTSGRFEDSAAAAYAVQSVNMHISQLNEVSDLTFYEL